MADSNSFIGSLLRTWIALSLLSLSSSYVKEALASPLVAVPAPGTSAKDVPHPYDGSSVTAALVEMDASHVTKYDGADQNNIAIDVRGQGPIPWSISRFNEGDFSPRIAPRHPFSQTNLGVPAGEQGFAASSPKDPSVQAWRPHPKAGVLLATVAQNGQQWNDKAPFFYGTVAAATDSSGYGYSLEDGKFGKSDPNCDVVVGKAGKLDEGNIDVAVAWFPFTQGWKGGYVQAPGGGSASWLNVGSHSPDLPSDASKVLKWDDLGASLDLPGVDARHDGMLFAISTDPGTKNNDVNVLSTMIDGREWKVQQREDNEVDSAKMSGKEGWMFSFVYIPFSASGLVGGHIDGSRGNAKMGRGQFKSKRVEAGRYEITCTAPSPHPMNERAGMVLLQVVDRERHNHKLTKHAFLSYNFTQQGSIVVESRTISKDKLGNDAFPLIDTDFYFAWIDYQQPLAPIPASNGVQSCSGAFIGWILFWGTSAVLVLCGVFAVWKKQIVRRARRFSFVVPFSEIVGEDDLEHDLLDGARPT